MNLRQGRPAWQCWKRAGLRLKSWPKKKIQNAEYAEYAEKWNNSAYFVYSAVLWPLYFGDVFESSAFRAVLSGSRR